MIAERAVSERRRFVRVPSDLPVQLRYMPQKNAGGIHNSISHDISESGLQLSSFYFYPVHSKMMIELYLAGDQEPIHAVGNVIWIEQIPYQERYKIGMEFIDVNEDSRLNLQQVISDFID